MKMKLAIVAILSALTGGFMIRLTEFGILLEAKLLAQIMGAVLLVLSGVAFCAAVVASQDKGERQMYFILSKREPRKAGGNCSIWTELGVVIAETPETAIKKLGLTETKAERVIRATGSFPGIFISLKDDQGNDYHLESAEEITYPITAS